MELRLLKHHEIDRSRWDAAIRSAYNPAVYGMSWYLDACAPGWSGLVCGDYTQVMAVPLRTRLGITAALQPLFVQQVGIFSQTVLTPDDVAHFFDYLNHKVGKVELYLTPECTPPAENFQTETRRSQYIPLEAPAAETRKNYGENLRRNIKKAEKAGLELYFLERFESVIEAFRAQPGNHVEQIGDEGFARLADLLGALVKHTQTYIAEVRDAGGKPLYTAFFSGFGKTLLYVKGAGSAEAKNTGAAHFLMDRMMALAREKGYAVFDFGGANAENVRKFNRQFVGGEFEYLCFRGGYLPAFLRKIR